MTSKITRDSDYPRCAINCNSKTSQESRHAIATSATDRNEITRRNRDPFQTLEFAPEAQPLRFSNPDPKFLNRPFHYTKHIQPLLRPLICPKIPSPHQNSPQIALPPFAQIQTSQNSNDRPLRFFNSNPEFSTAHFVPQNTSNRSYDLSTALKFHLHVKSTVITLSPFTQLQTSEMATSHVQFMPNLCQIGGETCGNWRGAYGMRGLKRERRFCT